MADNSTVPRKDTLPTYLIIILRYLNLDRSSSITFSKVEAPFVTTKYNTFVFYFESDNIIEIQSYIILLKQFFYNVINLYILLFFYYYLL